MQLPFSEAQFLDVFAAYNTTLWPAVAATWVFSAVLVGLWLAGRLHSGRWLSGLLAFHWAWAGLVYHLAFFSSINPAARVFGLLFLFQAGLWVWFGVVRDRLTFSTGRSPRQLLSALLVLYALAYPLVGMAAGLHYPRLASFGVPCPSTLLTVGLLLAALPAAAPGIWVIPFLWCLVGGSAAFVLGVRADLALPVAGLALLGTVVRPGARPAQVTAPG